MRELVPAIMSQALPHLRQELLQARTGAMHTSDAFAQSLQPALPNLRRSSST
jgi:hypothetical protein